jgi:hypothetical protein
MPGQVKRFPGAKELFLFTQERGFMTKRRINHFKEPQSSQSTAPKKSVAMAKKAEFPLSNLSRLRYNRGIRDGREVDDIFLGRTKA